MSDKLEQLKARVRETPLSERVERSMTMISEMCKQGRPPRMSIPVAYDDEDFFICTTLRDVRDLLKGDEKRRGEKFHPADLTDEFLSTLVEVARTVGHGAGDYHETVAFIQEVFYLAGKDIGREELTPYPAIDNIQHGSTVIR